MDRVSKCRNHIDRVYGHSGPKIFRPWSQSVHCKNPRHIGTSATVSWTFRHHLYFVHRNITLICLFKKDYFIDDLCHIWYFLYTTSLMFFCTRKPAYNRVSLPVLYYGDANANSFIEANSFVIVFCQITYR